jgi:chitinase
MVFKSFIYKLILILLKEIEKGNLCRDLRDCQVYFPCSMFLNDITQQQIQQCSSDYIFNEQRQECIEPETIEDLQCLLTSKYSSSKQQPQQKPQQKPQPLATSSQSPLPSRHPKTTPDNDPNNKYKRICVVTNWAQYRTGRARFQFEYINVHLCNYIIYSSVVIEEKEMIGNESQIDYQIKTTQHNDIELIDKLNSFKETKPQLKTILRVTDDNGRLFSKLSRRPETRSNFIKNLIQFINDNDFNGVDLFWQFPCNTAGSPFDKQNFILLLKDLYKMLDYGQELAITISPLNDQIQKSYSLLEINNYIDFVNINTFDYYGHWDQRTGIMAPLLKMDEQYLTEAFMNIEGTVTFLKALGLASNKMVLGLAAHSRTFTLQNEKLHGVNAPTIGNGFSGPSTKMNGLLSYYEVCQQQSLRSDWIYEWQNLAMAPYMYNSDNEWISYENEDSLKQKVRPHPPPPTFKLFLYLFN